MLFLYSPVCLVNICIFYFAVCTRVLLIESVWLLLNMLASQGDFGFFLNSHIFSAANTNQGSKNSFNKLLYLALLSSL